MQKLTLQSNQQLWFTSDNHWNHKNICSATTEWSKENDGKFTRKFDSLDKMNDTIVNNINTLVGENDILFNLGDWSFGGFEAIAKFRNRLVCKNIHIILGNHDHHIENNKDGIQSLFASVSNGNLELQVNYRSFVNNGLNDKKRFFLNHYPVCSWKDMSRGVIHLFGHVHLPPHDAIMKGKAMDVGMDGNYLFPRSFYEIMRIMDRQPISDISLPYDHHAKNDR